MAADQIRDGLVASIAYTLTVDGKVVEDVNDDEAIEYLHGEENIVPGLEKALVGKKVGDTFEITLAPEEGYGEYEDDLVEQVSREDFDDIEDLKPGLEIELVDDEGAWFEATIKEITDHAVVLDFNTPLAGKTLHYKIKVVAIREATESETEQGFPESLLEEMLEEALADIDGEE